MGLEKLQYDRLILILGVFSLEQSGGLGQTKAAPVVALVLFTAEKHRSCRLGGSNCLGARYICICACMCICICICYFFWSILFSKVRKLADLYFLMRMYKPAYNYAYISKKDFQTDEVESFKAGFQSFQHFPEHRLGLTMQLLLN